jgi:type I restriction enzyme M protein
MTEQDKRQLGATLWAIADQLRGAMNADDFRDYMLSFLFLRYLSDYYEAAARRSASARSCSGTATSTRSSACPPTSSSRRAFRPASSC